MRFYFILFFFFFLSLEVFPQNYPFQDSNLKDDKRLDNLISLMTLDEKINCLSPTLTIPRLGIKGTKIVEGLHGLALSGRQIGQLKAKVKLLQPLFPRPMDWLKCGTLI